MTTTTTSMALSHSSAFRLLTKAAVFVLVTELPLGVLARHCWTDNNGFVQCSSLSNGARIGIGVGIAVVFFLICCGIATRRRRHLQRYYRSFQPQTQPQQPYGQQPVYGQSPGYGQNTGHAGNAYGPPRQFNDPSHPQFSAPTGPPPGYNEPQVPGNVYQGSKV